MSRPQPQRARRADVDALIASMRLFRHATPDERLRWWRQDADYIAQAHRAGQYLSQAFSRNLVWSPDTVSVRSISRMTRSRP